MDCRPVECRTPICRMPRRPPGKCCSECEREGCEHLRRFYDDGQVFSPPEHMCDDCLCKDTQVKCEPRRCPPALCDYPIQTECCLQCTGESHHHHHHHHHHYQLPSSLRRWSFMTPMLPILSQSHNVFISHCCPFFDICHPLRSWPSSSYFPLWTLQYQPVDCVVSDCVTKVGSFSFLYCWNYVFSLQDIFIIFQETLVRNTVESSLHTVSCDTSIYLQCL